MDGRHHNAQGLGSCEDNSSSQPHPSYIVSQRPEVNASKEEVQCSQTQLLQSVEKVCAWQSNMKTKCDDLNRTLKEAEETRERQHQKILELQMKLEQISFCYDAELKNRETLRVQIANNHTVSDILQNHCQILSETMQRCVSERDRLTEQSDMQYQQICDLECRNAALKEEYPKQLESLNCSLLEERAQSEREQQKSIKDLTRLTYCYNILKEGLEALLAQERSRLADLQNKLMEANSQIEEMKKADILANQQFTKQLLSEEEKFAQISHSKEELQKSIRGFQEENAHLQTVVAEKEFIEEDLLQAKNRISQLEADLMKHVKTEEELNACIETTRNEMEHLRVGTKNLVAQSKSHESHMEQKLEKIRVQYEEEVFELRKTLDEVRNEAANTEVYLRHQVETCQAELETLKLQDQETEHALQHELHTALHSISELKQEISKISEEYQDAKLVLDKQITDLEDQIEAHHEAEQQTARELTKTHNELKQLHELLKAAQEAAAEREEVLQAKILDEKSHVETLQREAQILMEEQISAKATIAEKEIEKLECFQELEALRETLEEVTRRAKEWDKECNMLKEELEMTNKHVQTSENVNHDLKLKYQMLECNLLSAKSEVHELSNTISTKDSKISELENILVQTNNTCKELKNGNNELRLYEESSKKKSEDNIQMVNEKFLVEISVKNEIVIELETAYQRQDQKLREMQKILEELNSEFQNKLTTERDKTQKELHMTKEKYIDSLAVKDKMLEDINKQLVHSDQQVIHCKEEVTDLHKKLLNAENQIDQVVVEKETKIKILLRDLDGFKKTAENRLMKITKLSNQLKELQNNYHQTQEQNEHISTELRQVQAQLKQTQTQLKHAESEAHAAKTTADHIQATFAAYKAERKKLHMEAARRKTVLPGSLASAAPSPLPNTTCPQTPTNTEAPGTPRSILKSTQAPTPQSAKSPNRKVKFSVDYADSESSAMSVCFEVSDRVCNKPEWDSNQARPDLSRSLSRKKRELCKREREDLDPGSSPSQPEETEAIAKNPKLARVILETKKKEKENKNLSSKKRARKEDEVGSSLTQKENTSKKSSENQQSDTSYDAFDWLG